LHTRRQKQAAAGNSRIYVAVCEGSNMLVRLPCLPPPLVRARSCRPPPCGSATLQKPSYQQQVCSSASPKALISVGIAQHHSQRPEYRRVVRSMTPAAHQSNAPPWPLRQITHFLDGNLCSLPTLELYLLVQCVLERC